MMFPKSFFSTPLVALEGIPVLDDQPTELVTPGKVYRDCLAFGTSPDGVQGSLYDDAGCDQIDAACDLTVQKTDLLDKSFYFDNPEYQMPNSLKKRDMAPVDPVPTAPPAGNSADSPVSVEPSAPLAE